MPEVWEQKGHLRAGACLRGDFQEKLKGSALEGDLTRGIVRKMLGHHQIAIGNPVLSCGTISGRLRPRPAASRPRTNKQQRHRGCLQRQDLRHHRFSRSNLSQKKLDLAPPVARLSRLAMPCGGSWACQQARRSTIRGQSHGPQAAVQGMLKKVVSFSDLRQDVERLSADALRVWGAGPRHAACLLVFVCYGERRHVKGLQHAPDRSRKNAATTGLTEARSRQSITLAPTNLITVKEANRYVYGNDVELRDAVDKIRKVCDLPDGRLSTFREHDCPSTGSAIDSCDTRHNANTSPTLSSGCLDATPDNVRFRSRAAN
jgi:hypothetical protein